MTQAPPGVLARVWCRASATGRSARALLARRRAQPAASRRHVVVVSYGRSGSTLVQGLLNALPRTLVRGENGLYALWLHRAAHRAQEFRQLHLPHNPAATHSAFYGLQHLGPETFVETFAALLERHLLGEVDPGDVDVLGFKEVAWHRVQDDEQAAFTDFLDLVLPDLRYVLVTRHLDDVVTSGFWKDRDRDRTMAKIRRVESLQEHLRHSRPDRVHDVRYEDLAHPGQDVRDATMRALGAFATGPVDDVQLARMRDVASRGHGPYPFGASRS